MLDPRLYSILRSVRPFVTQDEFTTLYDALGRAHDRRTVATEPFVGPSGAIYYIEPRTRRLDRERRVGTPRRIGDR